MEPSRSKPAALSFAGVASRSAPRPSPERRPGGGPTMRDEDLFLTYLYIRKIFQIRDGTDCRRRGLWDSDWASV